MALKPVINVSFGQCGQLLVSEFLGVFFLSTIIGTGIANKQDYLALFVGAFFLTAQVYAHAGTAGSPINPAIALMVHLCRNDVMSTEDLPKYIIMQHLGGLAGWGLLGLVFFNGIESDGVTRFNLWKEVALAPVGDFTWGHAMLMEFLGGTLFLMVIANVACTKKDGGSQYYGVAIGCVLSACIVTMGPVSGCCINPAMGLAINFWHCVASGFTAENIKGLVAYTLITYTCSFAAALIFLLGRNDEFDDEEDSVSCCHTGSSQFSKLFVSEFLGTMWIAFVIGIGLNSGNALLPIFVGGMFLVGQVYAHMGTAGSCINPAISLMVSLCRPDVIEHADIWKYWVFEFTGGLAGWGLVSIFYSSTFEKFALAPAKGYGLAEAMLMEFLMTTFFLEVIANVACSPKDFPNHYFGLAIGGACAAAVVTMGPISGGCLNPALGFAINLYHAIQTGEGWDMLCAYTVIGLVASLAASVIFSLGRANEFEKGTLLNGDDTELEEQ